jgi:virginiamycin B lyase
VKRWRGSARAFLTVALAVGLLGLVAVTATAPASATTAVVTVQREPALALFGGTIATGPDGALWATNPDSASIIRIDSDGTVASFGGAGLTSPGQIVAGTAAMWFSNGTGSIGRITLGGEITTFSDSGIGNVTDMVEGPDGALWFTVIFADSTFADGWLGRITVDGDVTVFNGPDAYYPMGIVVGADGALWYTSPLGNFIGRITTSAVTTRFDHPTIRFPTALATGSDGAMWFANSRSGAGAESIGRITTAGAVSNHPNAAFSPSDGGAIMTAGSDGNVWLAAGSERLVRVSASGAITSAAHPEFRYLVALAPSPGGVMYGRLIARVTPFDPAVGPIGGIGDPGGIARISISDAPVTSASAVVGTGGGTVSTGAAPDATDPIGASVTVPGPGSVEIVEQAVSDPAPTGYRIVGRTVDIEAPAATPEAPLRLRFAVHGSILATLGVSAANLVVLRNGVVVPPCAAPAQELASPDPCVFERVTLSGGDARVGVYTSAASRWNLVARTCPRLTVTTGSLPAGRVGQAYSARLAACSGVPPYRFKKSGKLPPGLKLNARTGAISGVPKRKTGTFPFTVSVTDAKKPKPRNVATRPMSIRVTR